MCTKYGRWTRRIMAIRPCSIGIVPRAPETARNGRYKPGLYLSQLECAGAAILYVLIVDIALRNTSISEHQSNSRQIRCSLRCHSRPLRRLGTLAARCPRPQLPLQPSHRSHRPLNGCGCPVCTPLTLFPTHTKSTCSSTALSPSPEILALLTSSHQSSSSPSPSTASRRGRSSLGCFRKGRGDAGIASGRGRRRWRILERFRI